MKSQPLSLALLLSMGSAWADEPANPPTVTQPVVDQPVATTLPPAMPVDAPPSERLVWNKVPLPISLPVNRERLVSFALPVRVGLPPDLGKDVLRTQIVDGTIYWTAYQAFSSHRIQVQAIGSGNTSNSHFERSAA